MERRQEIEQRFEAMFGISYERGLEHFKILLKRSVNFERFAPVGSFDHSKISMNERDFGIFAFFGCLGAGFVEELGLSALPPAEEIDEIGIKVIDAEYEEKSPTGKCFWCEEREPDEGFEGLCEQCFRENEVKS